MIYCVVPAALEGELFDKLTDHYADEPHVQVVVDRRTSERRSRAQSPAQHDGQREQRDRRRQRVTGEFPALKQPS